MTDFLNLTLTIQENLEMWSIYLEKPLPQTEQI